MDLSWFSLSSAVSLWWFFLVSVAVVNIVAWLWTRWYISKRYPHASHGPRAKWLVGLAAVYVFVCAFRGFLPRADVQRMVLFDTWFSNVLVGRSVATVAELSFVTQWAIVLNHGAKTSHSRFAEIISWVMVPLIFMAECFSWSAVITTNYLGNAFEESTWTITYSLLAIALATLWPKYKGVMKPLIVFAIFSLLLYIGFMVRVDVPMYYHRWQEDVANGKHFLGFWEGLKDLNSHWTVVHESEPWITEIPWMSLYFSLGVWASIALCYVPLTRESLSKYLD